MNYKELFKDLKKNFGELLQDRKRSLVLFILIMSIIGYTSDSWAISKDSNGSSTIFNLKGITNSGSEKCTKFYMCYDNDNVKSFVNKGGFLSALWLMRIYQILLIIALILIIIDEKKYKKIIEGIMCFTGIIGIITVYACILPSILPSINKYSDKTKDKALSFSSYLILLSSIGCLSYAGFSYKNML